VWSAAPRRLLPTAWLRTPSSKETFPILPSENNGHFTAGANLVIQDGSGQEVLRVNDAGPLLYVKLPAGQYTVHAIFEGVEREKSAKIGDKGTTTINLVWPTED